MIDNNNQPTGASNNFPKWLVNGLGGLLIAFVALLIIQKGHDVSATFKNQ